MLAVVGLGTVSILVTTEQSPPKQAGQVWVGPLDPRTVDWQENGAHGYRITQLVRGNMITEAMHGIIQTDTDCTPGPKGLSHCHHVVLLSDGERITSSKPMI